MLFPASSKEFSKLNVLEFFQYSLQRQNVSENLLTWRRLRMLSNVAVLSAPTSNDLVSNNSLSVSNSSFNDDPSTKWINQLFLGWNVSSTFCFTDTSQFCNRCSLYKAPLLASYRICSKQCISLESYWYSSTHSDVEFLVLWKHEVGQWAWL
jgi:hypothetical protein